MGFVRYKSRRQEERKHADHVESRFPPGTDKDLLTKQEEIDLAIKIKAGDQEARQKLASSNLRLVASIAMTYRSRSMTLNDMISEGTIGLMVAVDQFDPAHKTRFATYASWWIRNYISLAILKDRPVQIPVGLYWDMMRWNRAKERLDAKLGRSATNDEIAKETDLPANKVKFVLMALPAFAAGHLNQNDCRLDSNLQQGPVDDDVLDTRASLKQLNMMLQELDDVESMVVKLRFGLNGEEPMSLTQIGKLYSIDRTTVKLIERNAIRSLASGMTNNFRPAKHKTKKLCDLRAGA